MTSLFGIKVIENPYIPTETPVITFDPLRKCTWATPAYRASVDAWLLERFGTQCVAYIFDPKALGSMFGVPVIAMNPMHVAMIKAYT